MLCLSCTSDMLPCQGSFEELFCQKVVAPNHKELDKTWTQNL